MRKFREKLAILQKKFLRLNQVILTFPVWIVVGIAGISRSIGGGGWNESEKNERYEKMY